MNSSRPEPTDPRGLVGDSGNERAMSPVLKYQTGRLLAWAAVGKRTRPKA